MRYSIVSAAVAASMAVMPAAYAVVVPGGTYGIEGCSVTVEDIRIAEPGGPLVSVGNTQVDHRNCIRPVT